MLQKTFGIYSEGYEKGTLFIEAGLQHLAAWCKQPGDGKLLAFEFFGFEGDANADMNNILRDIRLQSKLMDIEGGPQHLTWETRDAVCVPAAYYADELAQQYLDLAMGEDGDTVVQATTINGQVIISRLPAGYINAVNHQYKDVVASHKFCSLLQSYFASAETKKTALYAVFYPHHFITTLVNDGKLQFIRSVQYTTSEDVLYTIMQVCGQYNLPANSTPIIASGLIDAASNLYNTLHSYLENFNLEEAGDVVLAEGFSDYHSHYFLPFIY